MNDTMPRYTIGGALAWVTGSVMFGLTPLVFLACGVYTGAGYGGIVSAVRAASLQPQPAYRPASTRSRAS